MVQRQSAGASKPGRGWSLRDYMALFMVVLLVGMAVFLL